MSENGSRLTTCDRYNEPVKRIKSPKVVSFFFFSFSFLQSIGGRWLEGDVGNRLGPVQLFFL